MNKRTLFFLLLINLPLLLYGLNTPQKNPEELFLSDEYLKHIQSDRDIFEAKELVFISGIKESEEENLGLYFDQNDLAYSNLSALINGLGLLEIPKNSDEENIKLFNEIKTTFPELKFAGDAFTNMNLAKMAIKIQETLFPFIFSLIFLGLLILTRNFKETLYLFLTSLIGPSSGLAIVKLLYGHSTILTTLTPLIGFILTLGIQFHILWGHKVFQTRDLFLKHKMRPILIMMLTTLIGFLSLSTSNLESIRQFSISVSLSLTFTWGLSLFIIYYFPLSNLERPKSTSQKSFSAPQFKPIWGYGILLSLSLLGITAFKKMPILVDAVYFFPPGHEIRTGHEDISTKLKGTPQFEIILERKDKRDLQFSDLQKINSAELELKKKYGPEKVLSLNELVRQVNLIYSKIDHMPDNSFAYEALTSKIPPTLNSLLRSEKGFKFIFLDHSVPDSERESISKEFHRDIKKLLPDYHVRISGLMHFLLLSQKNLVLTLVQSFTLSFLLISFVFAFSQRNKKDLLHFCLINIASILGGLFLMWIFGMTLNISTVMTVSISMGLVVDSTIHLIHSQHLKENLETRYQSNIVPILLSHLIFLGAFGLLSFEDFLPIGDFSKGLFILLLVGLVCDLLVLPNLNKSHLG